MRFARKLGTRVKGHPAAGDLTELLPQRDKDLVGPTLRSTQPLSQPVYDLHGCVHADVRLDQDLLDLVRRFLVECVARDRSGDPRHHGGTRLRQTVADFLQEPGHRHRSTLLV